MILLFLMLQTVPNPGTLFGLVYFTHTHTHIRIRSKFTILDNILHNLDILFILSSIYSLLSLFDSAYIFTNIPQVDI